MSRTARPMGSNSCSASRAETERVHRSAILTTLTALLLTAGSLVGCSRSPLYTDLTETQANEVQAALLSAHIDAQKSQMTKAKGWSIAVAHDEIPNAMAVLGAPGLPRQALRTLGDVFPKESFVSSPLEERARYIF